MAAEDYMVPCMSKKFFGIDCFGCGTQRALMMLFEGDFKGAFELYPAIYTLILLVAVFVISFFDKKRSYSAALIGLGVINALIIVVSYFFRHPELF